MRLTPLSMALAAAITASSAAQAQEFSKVVSFGDSLSDAGNIALVDGNPATPVGSSFTTNPTDVYAQTLSLLLGLGTQSNNTPLVPTTSTGSNYAYGGACAMSNGTAIVSAIPGLPTFTCSNSPGNFSLQTQFTTHLTANGGKADPNAIYTYWAGANDILSATSVILPGQVAYLPNGSFLFQYLAGGGSAANASAIAQTVAGQAGATAAGQVKFLQSNGANYIVVFNLPDLGKTPLNVGTANATGATALSIVYNNELQKSLATANDGIIAINTFGIINEVTANPAAYGFTNITATACPGGVSSLACGPASAGYPVAPISDTYLFADSIHPSGRAHTLLANIVYSTITAPGLVSLAPEVAMQSAFNHSTAISDALDAEWSSGSEVGKVRGFTSVQYGQMEADPTTYSPAMDADSLDLNIGATYRASEAFIFGVAATLGSNDGDAGFAGELDGSALLFGVFGQYEINGLYGRLGFSIGSNDMDIDRRIDQLSSTRTETGSTSISQQVGTLEIGYVFKGDNFTHGPYAGVELINNEVDGYTEEGTSATAMRFDEFSRDSNITSIGYQFSGKFDSFQPFARIAYVNETNSDQTFVRAGTASMPGNFSMGGFTPGDSSFIDWNLGVSMTFADSFDGYLSYRGRNGNEVTDNGTFSLGLRKTF